MKSRSTLLLALAASTLAASGPLRAQGLVVDSKTTYSIPHIGNGDLRQTTSILGTDRQKTVTEGRIKFLLFGQDAGGTEIIRLDRDKAYVRGPKDTAFRERDFAAMRAQMEQNQQKATEAAPQIQTEDENVRLYVVSEGLKPTGERRSINGFDTQQEVWRATVMAEDKKTGEKAPVFYLTADVWTDPSHAGAAKVMQAFAQQYAKQLGMEPTVAANPYARWVKQMMGEVRAIEGYPILARLTVEADASKDPDSKDAKDAEAARAEAADKVGKAVGGLLKRMRKKPAEDAPAAVEAPKAAPGRALLFQMTQEVTSLSEQAPPASEFEVPAG